MTLILKASYVYDAMKKYMKSLANRLLFCIFACGLQKLCGPLN